MQEAVISGAMISGAMIPGTVIFRAVIPNPRNPCIRTIPAYTP